MPYIGRSSINKLGRGKMKKIFALIFGLLVICSTLASVSAVDIGNKNFGIQNSKTANSRYLSYQSHQFIYLDIKI